MSCCIFLPLTFSGILSFSVYLYSKSMVMLDSELYSVSTSLSSKQDVIIKSHAVSRLVMTVKTLFSFVNESIVTSRKSRRFFLYSFRAKFYINL